VLRDPRNQETEKYLLNPNPETKAAMQSARSTFGMWHGISLTLNLAAILCVTGATILAAHLPAEAVRAGSVSDGKP